MAIEIREDRPDDVAAIRDVNKRAFDADTQSSQGEPPFSGCIFQTLVV